MSGRSSPAFSDRIQWVVFPAIVWWGLFVGVPLILIAAISVASRGIYGGVEWSFTLSAYQYLADPLYLRIYLRSLALAVATTAICLLLGFPLAWYMANLPPRRQMVWRMLVMIPLWTNFLVRTYAWMFVLRADGLLNTVLMATGLISSPLEILYTDRAVLIGLVYGYLPFMVLPLYAALERLDRSLIEAARDLYAPGWARFTRIIVPLAKPGIVAGCVLVFIPSLGAYLTPDLLGGARSMMVGNLIQHEYLVVRDWPMGSAASLALLAVVVVGLRLLQRAGWTSTI
jgi:spermidine/putrescine transport system permease protein